MNVRAAAARRRGGAAERRTEEEGKGSCGGRSIAAHPSSSSSSYPPGPLQRKPPLTRIGPSQSTERGEAGRGRVGDMDWRHTANREREMGHASNQCAKTVVEHSNKPTTNDTPAEQQSEAHARVQESKRGGDISGAKTNERTNPPSTTTVTTTRNN